MYVTSGNKVMRKILVCWIGLVVVLTTNAIPVAHSENAEIEQLRKEYEQQMKSMRESFDKRLKALEETASEKKSGNELGWYWKDGIRVDSENSDFQLKFGGRVHLDSAFFDADSDLKSAFGEDFEDGSEFRRTRLSIGGKVYEDFDFKVQLDFAGGDSEFKDVYMGVNTQAGKLRIGQFKEPFSLDELTSSNNIQFMERALPVIFAPSRNTGLAYFNTLADEKMTFATGVFRNSDSFGDANDEEDEIAITGRITGLPWMNEEGDRYLHLGAAVSIREADKDESSFRYRQRPEAHLSPVRLVDTSSIDGWENTKLIGLESALVLGSFATQAEYMTVEASFDETLSGGIDEGNFSGWYVQGSYFLTGEHRSYKASSGIFDKVKPKANFKLGESGMGAWEIAARYSTLDLDDGAIDGGEMNDVSVALNWYLNPNMRIGLNYINSTIKNRMVGGVDLDDSVDVIQTRFQVTW